MPSSQEKAKDLLSLSSSARMKALEANCQASCPADLSIWFRESPDFRRQVSLRLVDWSTSIKHLQVRSVDGSLFKTSVLSKHIDHVSGLPYKSNLRLEEWVTALFFLEAWLREVPVRRQTDDAKKAAAQALQQEAEELIVTWWSRFEMDKGS